MIQVCCDKLLAFHLLLISFHLMSVVKCGSNEILTLTANERGKVEIQCPYESRYEENVKYLCKGECKILNKDIPVSSGSTANDKRFSLIDNSTTHIFTVTITDLRPEDEHTYWCGVKTGFGHFDDNTKILLKIKQDGAGSFNSITTPKPLKIYINTNQPACAHFTVTTVTSSSSHSYAELPTMKSDLIAITTLSITVTLLVFGLSLFVCRLKRVKNVLVISGDEGLCATKNDSELCTYSSCVYTSGNLPTNSSKIESFVCVMAHLPTNPSEMNHLHHCSAAQLNQSVNLVLKNERYYNYIFVN
ncbi:CMRF35-like molecule 5 isoform X2 [Myxocyprinus asiaticus]|uniref:CMRF35-like molecule 5 isoform X2 n=1 Tax=Myxocyprinus asiaticus TaxID=70543 RepID=UPI0022214E2D|nr:CMRF35-like molecule 5 isoform X2 [Myxocyprinus asiaticus]